MDCLEFRRVKLADPGRVNEEMASHLRECAACAAFAARCDDFEVSLEAAARIPVDDGLAKRIVLNRRLGGPSRQNWALAASILLVAALTGTLAWQVTAPNPVLATASAEHVIGEPIAMAARQKIADAELAKALALSGAKLSRSLEVSYLHDCPVPGGWGKHIVLNTPLGKATLITMPNQKIYRRLAMGEHGLSVAVAPARMGSFAVIADSPRALAMAEKTVNDAIDWSA